MLIKITIFITLFFSSQTVLAKPVKKTNKQSAFEFAIERLQSINLSPEFIEYIKANYVEEDRDEIVPKSVLGFLVKRSDYRTHYSDRAVRRCEEFIETYGKYLRKTEEKQGIPKQIIAALIWVETKFGTQLGKHNINEVFFYLAMADHPDLIKISLDELKRKDPVKYKTHKLKVRKRSKDKAQWALKEIKALDEMFRKKPEMVKSIKSSFAGAFGIPQFIPSSYLKWAKSATEGQIPDLYKLDDAIESVGYYLKTNGWKKNNGKAQRNAIYHYNNADGYVDVIMKIATDIQ